jgi:hypothetical protein
MFRSEDYPQCKCKRQIVTVMTVTLGTSTLKRLELS